LDSFEAGQQRAVLGGDPAVIPLSYDPHRRSYSSRDPPGQVVSLQKGEEVLLFDFAHGHGKKAPPTLQVNAYPLDTPTLKIKWESVFPHKPRPESSKELGQLDPGPFEAGFIVATRPYLFSVGPET
jgi:hypothetical protein